jgi:hypothetical protein
MIPVGIQIAIVTFGIAGVCAIVGHVAAWATDRVPVALKRAKDAAEATPQAQYAKRQADRYNAWKNKPFTHPFIARRK